jgi:hypothetical protein
MAMRHTHRHAEYNVKNRRVNYPRGEGCVAGKATHRHQAEPATAFPKMGEILNSGGFPGRNGPSKGAFS